MIEPPSAAATADAVAGRVRVWRDHLHFDGLPVGRVPRADEQRPALRQRLADVLYARWFTRSWSPPPAWSVRPLTDRLHHAHAGARRHEPGWVALAADGDGVIAMRSGAPTWLDGADYRNLTRRTGPPVPGDSLAVIDRRDSVDATGAWWTAWSARPPDPLEVRLYWHCDADHAAALVAAITAVLEAAGVAYSMKCPSHEQLFGRADAAVVYLSIPAWLRVKAALKRVHAGAASWLGDAVPPCTLALGRGVAVAQDPGPLESFGQSRAGAVAEGVVAAVADGDVTSAGLATGILAAMTRRGICLARPYRTEHRHADDALWHW